MSDPGLTVRPAGPGDEVAWDRYVLRHPGGLGYHLWAWGHAVERAYGFEAVCLAARQGERICGILPLVRMGLPLKQKRLVSLPYCDAGGILADSEAAARVLLTAAQGYGAGQEAVEYRAVETLPDLSAPETCHPGKVRMVKSLPDTVDDLVGGLTAKVRSQARKPEKDGLTFELGGAELVSVFYDIFKENMRDLGSPVHAVGFFREIMTAFGSRAHIGLVRLPDGRPAASGILLCHPVTISIPWASSLRRHNTKNPNMMLYWQFLKFAVGKGAQTFDFGRSTPEEGTYRFKKQWGAMPRPLHWVSFDRDGRLIRPDQVTTKGAGPLRAGAEACISRMPLALASWVGSRLRKYISL